MRREAGFTLVELLIALALMALLSTLLVGGLRLSRNAVTAGENASEGTQRAELAFAVIRREIERAAPLQVVGIDAPPPIAFAGDEAGIVFIAPPGALMAPGGEEITWLATERDAAGARLVLRYRPLDRAQDQWPPALDPNAMQTVVLLDGIANAAFSYFGRARPDGDPQWWPAWKQPTVLPSLVRIAIEGKTGAWPDLVVAPRLNRPVDTGYLPAGPLCRRGGAFAC